MEKITRENAVEISQQCDRESYFTSPFFLTENCYFQRTNDEVVLFIDHPVDKEVRYLYLPQNIPQSLAYDVQFAREEDIQRLEKVGVQIKEKVSYDGEYIYNRENLAKAEGPDLSKFRQSISYFKRHYDYKILHEYDSENVRTFINWWARKKDLSGYSDFAREVFMWDLGLCLNYPYHTTLPQSNIFLEVDGKLAGFAFTHSLTSNMFVGLMQKVNVEYRGLSHFLYHEKAKLHSGVPYFTIGTACATPGLGKFKDSMHPVQKIPTYLLKVKSNE